MSVQEPYLKLELDLSVWAEVEDVVVCSSGTAALHLALETLELPHGSYVVVPEYTMIACARAITLAGLKPLFVDCNQNLLLDVNKVREVCQNPPGLISALMPVHIYGRHCQMKDLIEIAEKYSIKVVEDLAEAHGIKKHPKSDAACWSFYRNKIIAGEEGGAIAFKDPKLARRAESLRCLGLISEGEYFHRPRGHNYRMANCLAQKVLDSLENYQQNLEVRRELEAHAIRRTHRDWTTAYRDAPWVYDIRIKGMNLDTQQKLIKELRRTSVPARPGFKPLSLQEEYSQGTPLPWNALQAGVEVIYLSLQPDLMTKPLVDKAFDIIHKVAK